MIPEHVTYQENVYAVDNVLECVPLHSTQKRCNGDRHGVWGHVADTHGTSKIWPARIECQKWCCQ